MSNGFKILYSKMAGIKSRVFLLLGLFGIIASCFLSGAPIYSNGLKMFAWDDSEYIMQILNTHDYVANNGIVGWPVYMIRHQGAKPPLFINTAIPYMLVLGRNRLTTAVAALIVTNAIILVVAAFVLVGYLANYWYGLLVAMALLCLPGVSRWLPTAHPDAQLAIIVLLTIGLLASTREPWSSRKTFFFGALLGLGVLSKTTYLSFIGLPIIYYLFFGGAGKIPFTRRLMPLALATIVGLCVALIWYYRNLDEALNYMKSSSSFEIGVERPLRERVQSWLVMLGFTGIGYYIIAIGLFGLVLRVLSLGRKREPGLPIPRDFHIYFILGSLPFIIIAMRTHVPPNTRHILSSCLLIAFSILMFTIQAIERYRMRRVWLVTPVLLVVLAQFTITLLAENVATAAQIRKSNKNVAALRKFVPSIHELRPLPSEAISRTIAMIWNQVKLSDNWYISGNTADLNASRLYLFKLSGHIPIRIAWCSYFTWTEQRCRETLNNLKRQPCVLIVYEPACPAGSDNAYMNRYNKITREFVDNPANGFTLLPGTTINLSAFKLQFYTNVRTK